MSTAVSQPRSEADRRIVLMGVAGCGKSAVGAFLATKLGGSYIDGDDLHPSANIAKMSRGEPLTDGDRWPWLALVGQRLASSGGMVVIGCSALKRNYRDHIRNEAERPVMFVHLSGSKDLISARIAARAGHFMPTILIDSQFQALEPPTADENALTVDIDKPLQGIVDEILRAITSV